MKININQIPFSMRGSYMAVSYHPENFKGMNNHEGVYLRNMHGSAAERSVCRLVPTQRGKEIDYTYEANASELKFITVAGTIELCFANPKTILIRGTGDSIGIRLENISNGDGYNYVHEVPYLNNIYYMMNCSKNNCRYMVNNQAGTLEISQDWNVERTSHAEVSFMAENGKFLVAIEEVPIEWAAKELSYDYDDCKNKVQQAFEQYYHSMPTVPKRYEEAREIAAYVNWESTVSAYGFLTREAMFMSKNWMTNVWSWDHCFNAMVLAYGNPKEAWDQFMVMFDHQDTTGILPDSINDAIIVNNFCKPPIHGWALSKMMQVMDLTNEQVQEAYDKLEKWTNWWLNCRDTDKDGVCEYHHGNDSGWDNATTFRVLPPVELPDLSAFLVLQMDTLSDLSLKLSNTQAAMFWKEKADSTLKAMLEHCFDGLSPIAVTSRTHERISNDSLILYLPIVLGKRLPENVRNHLIDVLKSDKFYTNYGFATESPSSESYLSDGYWRGPIWAPSTMIIIDGLYKSGEVEFAKEATNKFCKMIEQSGCAENFDAITGDGLRDRAYTWTSSAFMVMAHEYLESSN